MDKHLARGQRVRPDSLLAALQFLKEHGGGMYMHARGVTAGGLTPAGQWLDTGHLHELMGVHLFRGKLVIGLNMRHAELVHASLLRKQTLCLVESCEVSEHQSSSLGQDLHVHPWPDTVAVLATLAAEVEMARLTDHDHVQRDWVPWDEALLTLQQEPQLPLAVRIDAWSGAVGSAYVPISQLPALTSTVDAAVVHLHLREDTQMVGAVQMGLMTAARLPLRLSAAEAALQSHGLQPDSLHRSADIAQAELTQYLQNLDTPLPYSINPTAHLIRVALDRAVARARAAIAS